MNTAFQIFLRTLLKAAAGWLISRGFLQDSQTEEFIGAGILGAGVLWSWWTHRQAKAQGAREEKQLAKVSAPAPPTPLILLLALALPAAMLAGCAFNRQFATTTQTNPTNGVVQVTTARSTTFALGDAKTIVDKTRASAGKTSSVGASGLNQEASTGNIATNLQALTGLLNAMRP